MTPEQITAIESPCERAEQCANAKYRAVHRFGKQVLTSLLTVNVGKE